MVWRSYGRNRIAIDILNLMLYKVLRLPIFIPGMKRC